jgi:hypothetical protein
MTWTSPVVNQISYTKRPCLFNKQGRPIKYPDSYERQLMRNRLHNRAYYRRKKRSR